MRDITITTQRQKTELKFLAISFLMAFGLNIVSIMAYNTEWKELYSQIIPMIALTAIIYFGIVLIRSILNIFRKK